MKIFLIAPGYITDVFANSEELTLGAVKEFAEQVTTISPFQLHNNAFLFTSLEAAQRYFDVNMYQNQLSINLPSIYEYEFSGTVHVNERNEGKILISKQLPDYHHIENIYRVRRDNAGLTVTTQKFSAKALLIPHRVEVANKLVEYLKKFFDCQILQMLTVDQPLVIANQPSKDKQRLEWATGIAEDKMMTCFLEILGYNFSYNINEEDRSISTITLPLGNFLTGITQEKIDMAMAKAFYDWQKEISSICEDQNQLTPRALFIMQFFEKIKLFNSNQIDAIITSIKQYTSYVYHSDLSKSYYAAQFPLILKGLLAIFKNEGDSDDAKNLIISRTYQGHEFKCDIKDLLPFIFKLMIPEMNQNIDNLTNARFCLSFLESFHAVLSKEQLKAALEAVPSNSYTLSEKTIDDIIDLMTTPSKHQAKKGCSTLIIRQAIKAEEKPAASAEEKVAITSTLAETGEILPTVVQTHDRDQEEDLLSELGKINVRF